MKTKIEVQIRKSAVIHNDAKNTNLAYISELHKAMTEAGIEIVTTTHLHLDSWLKYQNQEGAFKLTKRLHAFDREIFIFTLKDDRCPECYTDDIQSAWTKLLCNKCGHKWKQ